MLFMLLLMLTFCHLTWAKSSQIPVIVITDSKPATSSPPATIINNNQNQNSAGLFAFNWLQSPQTKAAASYLYNACCNLLYTHRFSIACCTALCIMFYLYHLHNQADYLLHTPTWSQWCLDHNAHTISTDHLLKAIHQHHLNQTNINNSTLLFADFLRALEEEKKKLQKTRWAESFLKKLYLRALFKSSCNIDQIMNDLSTLRIRFIDWYAHQIITKGLYGT